MSVPKSEKYIDDKKYDFLVVETFELKCYGFNLKKHRSRSYCQANYSGCE
jgi:hypothetical protein